MSAIHQHEDTEWDASDEAWVRYRLRAELLETIGDVIAAGFVLALPVTLLVLFVLDALF